MDKQVLHISDIERFAIHDGPGIRTVVFLQGCPLYCPWCANPETWRVGPQLMHMKSKCTLCGLCADRCPVKAIKITEGLWEVDRVRCTKCKHCADVCPHSAIHVSGQTMSTAEVLEIVLRDKAYYRNSGGGITLSGGEPFFQFAGAMDLLTQSKAYGLHTAVETSGHVDPSLFAQTISLVDLYLFDLKHSDADTLQTVTGGNLKWILDNLRRATTHPGRVIIRIPVIPGFNDTAETMDGIFRLALEHQVSIIELLPYHTLGKSKYAQLGMAYAYDNTQAMMTDEALTTFRKQGELLGLTMI